MNCCNYDWWLQVAIIKSIIKNHDWKISWSLEIMINVIVIINRFTKVIDYDQHCVHCKWNFLKIYLCQTFDKYCVHIEKKNNSVPFPILNQRQVTYSLHTCPSPVPLKWLRRGRPWFIINFSTFFWSTTKLHNLFLLNVHLFISTASSSNILSFMLLVSTLRS